MPLLREHYHGLAYLDMIILVRLVMSRWAFIIETDYGLSARAVAISDLSGADSTTPTLAKKGLVSDRDRHIIAGCDPENNIGGTAIIRFGSQADNMAVFASNGRICVLARFRISRC